MSNIMFYEGQQLEMCFHCMLFCGETFILLIDEEESLDTGAIVI